MFGKNNKNAVVKFEHESEGHSGSSRTVPLKDGQLLELLKECLDRHGELVIQRITANNEIHVTNTRTLEHRNAENRIEEIAEFIRDFANNRAYEMEGHAVFFNGKLKGVFGSQSLAELKKKNLISKGYEAENVHVKPIDVNSFKNFE